MELLPSFMLHKLLPIATAYILIFVVCSLIMNFTQMSSFLKVFNLKKSGITIFVYNLIFMVGYNNESIIVQRKLFFKKHLKDKQVNKLLFLYDESMPMLFNVISLFNLVLDYL